MLDHTLPKDLQETKRYLFSCKLEDRRNGCDLQDSPNCLGASSLLGPPPKTKELRTSNVLGVQFPIIGPFLMISMEKPAECLISKRMAGGLPVQLCSQKLHFSTNCGPHAGQQKILTFHSITIHQAGENLPTVFLQQDLLSHYVPGALYSLIYTL